MHQVPYHPNLVRWALTRGCPVSVVAIVVHMVIMFLKPDTASLLVMIIMIITSKLQNI